MIPQFISCKLPIPGQRLFPGPRAMPLPQTFSTALGTFKPLVLMTLISPFRGH